MKNMFLEIFICSSFILGSTGQDTVSSIFLQRSGRPSPESYARMTTDFPELRNFTICYRIRLHRFREESTLMSYAVSNDMDNELRMDHRKTGYKVSIHSTWAKTKIISPFDLWSHYCVTYNSYSNDWAIFENGKFIAQGRLPKYDGVIIGGGAYIIGQEQDSLGGGFQRDQSFSGEITELNVWSSILTEEQVADAASCTIFVEGDILAWSNISWELHGEAEFVTVERGMLCENSYRKIVVFTELYSLLESIKLCRRLGGSLAVPLNDNENELLYNTTLEKQSYCSSGSSFLWLGANDINTERTWVSWATGLPVSWEGPWRGDGPNGGTEENCLVMLNKQFPARWSDIACLDSYFFCTPCEFEDHVLMKLKGPVMCETSPFDEEFFVERSTNGSPSIAGIYHSKIVWNTTTSSWHLISMKDDTAVAVFTPSSSKKLPIGKNPWVVHFDGCKLIRGQSVNLTLSICKDFQFTCEDGSCIDLDKRCNLNMDCDDNSDEQDCSHVDIPNGYIKSIPPPTDTEERSIIPIHLYLFLQDFPSIQTQNLVFQTTLDLHLKWKDTRLNFLNLKEHRSLNVLSPSSVQKIWTPTVFFRNAFGNMFTNLEKGSRVECLREGNGSSSSREKQEQMTIYKGSENSLKMSQHYMASYSCDFQLAMFPFDHQTCSMYFSLVSAASSYMILITERANYEGSSDLIEYTIGNVTYRTANHTEYSEVEVTVRFIRRYAFYLLTSYVPSILLVMIAYATLFFDPKDFNSRIVVALTTLLVLSSLFTQTSNSLPKTSYYKLIDIWLFFSTVIIFVTVVFHTVAEYFSYSLREDPKMALTKVQPIGHVKIRSSFHIPEYRKHILGYPINIFFLLAGRFAIPIIYLLFNAIYWGVALEYLSTSAWIENSHHLK